MSQDQRPPSNASQTRPPSSRASSQHSSFAPLAHRAHSVTSLRSLPHQTEDHYDQDRDQSDEQSEPGGQAAQDDDDVYDDNVLDDDALMYNESLIGPGNDFDYNHVDELALPGEGNFTFDGTASSNGRKRPRSNSMDGDENRYRRAKKISQSKGRPKASDYSKDVQDVLESAIAHYKADLLRWDPYPDRSNELAWTKASWDSANKECNLKIALDSELMRMVSSLLLLLRLFTYIRLHVAHLICVAKSRRRSNRLWQACMASKFPPMKQFAPVTVTWLKNSKKGTRFYTRFVILQSICLFFHLVNTIYRHVQRGINLNRVYTNTKSFKWPSTSASSRTGWTLACNSRNSFTHFLCVALMLIFTAVSGIKLDIHTQLLTEFQDRVLYR
jgi:hypothetical protein